MYSRANTTCAEGRSARRARVEAYAHVPHTVKRACLPARCVQARMALDAEPAAALPSAAATATAPATYVTARPTPTKATKADDTDDDSSASAPIKSYTCPSQSVLDQKVQDALREQIRVAVWRHDVFNLFALGAINLMNCWYMASGKGAINARFARHAPVLIGQLYAHRGNRMLSLLTHAFILESRSAADARNLSYTPHSMHAHNAACICACMGIAGEPRAAAKR